MAAPAAKTFKDYATNEPSWWCPGCGDFGVLAAIQRAFADLGLKNEEILLVAGIGCSGKISGYVKAYGYHSLHGRALPPAVAAKLANKDLTVVAVGGDGDGYGIGAGHFVHAVRRNVNVTYIVMDNHIYGLTKGQVSPTSDLGFVTGTTPHGNAEAPLNPLALFLSAGGSFLAQGFSGDMKGLKDMIQAAIEHEGFSLVNVFSPCVTFNKKNTYAWYRDVLVSMDGEEIKHDPSDKQAAMRLALSDKIYTGIFYQEKRPTLEAQALGLQGPPLTKLDIEKGYDYKPILDEFK
ncbi:MAG TPA: 2-oxoacid:ferredoxin oxidoreductase subunit beta [Candidatus Thermoplasmatota archaeon]|nr:2-oxoacid:ferredoxin oxidoreductase subunit beta [Candidatus Thermoplasmatota archaeon]